MRPLTKREKTIIRTIFIVGGITLLILTSMIIVPPVRLYLIQRNHLRPYGLAFENFTNENLLQLHQWYDGKETIHFDAHRWGISIAPNSDSILVSDDEGNIIPISLFNMDPLQSDWMQSMHFRLLVKPEYPDLFRNKDGKPYHFYNYAQRKKYQIERIRFYEEGLVFDYDTANYEKLYREANRGIAPQRDPAGSLIFHYQDGHLVEQEDRSLLGSEVASINLEYAYAPKAWLPALEGLPYFFSLIDRQEDLDLEDQPFQSIQNFNQLGSHVSKVAPKFLRAYQHQLRQSGFAIVDTEKKYTKTLISNVTHLFIDAQSDQMLLKTQHGLYQMDMLTKKIQLIHPNDPLHSQQHKWIKL
ncbi:hypothetical protein PVA45_07710 (plasmid) [Entomospira entomophila]|uniref:Uncharacterized protein n=1 Tax=Entomospira entomophila TaxID=2719988 RepID=A0A968GFA5_9SPIO|nr:hypothetical protein [Entomospira entomophilus]NIZ41389.1 hypothetical protein [Entomospira entomophilus]WDI36339.1 hypothetical protein PVA45_07710 [Entomospira entomophilus]